MRAAIAKTKRTLASLQDAVDDVAVDLQGERHRKLCKLSLRLHKQLDGLKNPNADSAETAPNRPLDEDDVIEFAMRGSDVETVRAQLKHLPGHLRTACQWFAQDCKYECQTFHLCPPNEYDWIHYVDGDDRLRLMGFLSARLKVTVPEMMTEEDLEGPPDYYNAIIPETDGVSVGRFVDDFLIMATFGFKNKCPLVQPHGWGKDPFRLVMRICKTTTLLFAMGGWAHLDLNRFDIIVRELRNAVQTLHRANEEVNSHLMYIPNQVIEGHPLPDNPIGAHVNLARTFHRVFGAYRNAPRFRILYQEEDHEEDKGGMASDEMHDWIYSVDEEFDLSEDGWDVSDEDSDEDSGDDESP